jgi:hypothetical protein
MSLDWTEIICLWKLLQLLYLWKRTKSMWSWRCQMCTRIVFMRVNLITFCDFIVYCLCCTNFTVTNVRQNHLLLDACLRYVLPCQGKILSNLPPPLYSGTAILSVQSFLHISCLYHANFLKHFKFFSLKRNLWAKVFLTASVFCYTSSRDNFTWFL